LCHSLADRHLGTQDITPKSVLVDNAWVNLIDTPGWDDTYRTDTDILTLIGDYVGSAFSAGQLLQGVILLQLVDGTRVYGTERRRNRLYERICGMDAYRNIVVATTMWSTVVDQAAADQRIQQRIESPEFWDSMVQGGPFATSPAPFSSKQSLWATATTFRLRQSGYNSPQISRP
jgi:hypothetical protein